jgi:hypothetical protein
VHCQSAGMSHVRQEKTGPESTKAYLVFKRQRVLGGSMKPPRVPARTPTNLGMSAKTRYQASNTGEANLKERENNAAS